MASVVISRKKIHWKALVFFLALTLGLGYLSSLLGDFSSYDSFVKPPFSPPGWLFPIAWSILYFLMAIAAYLVWVTSETERALALRWYLVQLLVNVLWPLIFFRLEWRLFAFFWLLLLIALVSLTMVGFRYVSKAAYWLLVPYLLWLLYAAYLNLGIYLLNV